MPSFQRDKPAEDRNAEAASRYAEAIIKILSAEWDTVPALRSTKSIGVSKVRKILARSSADALLGLVLQRLIMDELVEIRGDMLHFEPKLIRRFGAQD